MSLAIIGAGNLGVAIARGLIDAEFCAPSELQLTRRHPQALEPLRALGCATHADNARAVGECERVIVAVEPQQIDRVLEPLAESFRDGQLLISVASGVTLHQLRRRAGSRPTIVRAMPNTAVAVRQSMTCLSVESPGDERDVLPIFDALGTTLVIDEEQMTAATALAACGIAFFLRAVRAASQGGIEIGIHSGQALAMAAQTAKGAASLLLAEQKHPEREIDRVTTPRGCTIAGLNQMEHGGFSSAMIRGITTSAEKASQLYARDED